MASILERYGRHAGFLSPALFMAFCAAAVAGYRGYSPLTNYVSDLGVNPHSAILFNLGVLLSGPLGIVFMAYLWSRSEPGPVRSGAFLMGAALVFFTLLSVFTEQDFAVHIVFAGMFFALALAAMVLTAAGLQLENGRLAAFSLITAALIAPLPFTAFNPLAEHVAAGAVLAWTLAMWHYMGARDSYLRYEWVWM